SAGSKSYSLRSFAHQGDLPLRKGRVWLCLILVVAFLYNPFVVAPSVGAGFQVHRSQSNRATVGASELQDFAAKARHVAVPLAECVFAVSLFSCNAVPQGLLPPVDDVHLPQRFSVPSLWFRPPPVS